MRVSLQDPAFDQDPKLRAIRTRFRWSVLLFVGGLIGGPGAIILARQYLDAATFVPVASAIGVLAFAAIGSFVYYNIALGSGVKRYRMQRAERTAQATLARRAAKQQMAAEITLPEQLRQLEEARAAGLIQEAEYQAKRAEIMARF